MVSQLVEHQRIQAVHRDRTALALGRPLLRATGTGVVAVAIELARPQRHARATGGTYRHAGEQDRSRYDAGRCPLGIAVGKECLHAIEQCPLDDGWHFHRDPVGPWAYLARLRLSDVEPVAAGVALLREDAMHLGDGEGLTTEADTFGVQLIDDRLDAKLPSFS